MLDLMHMRAAGGCTGIGRRRCNSGPRPTAHLNLNDSHTRAALASLSWRPLREPRREHDCSKPQRWRSSAAGPSAICNHHMVRRTGFPLLKVVLCARTPWRSCASNVALLQACTALPPTAEPHSSAAWPV